MKSIAHIRSTDKSIQTVWDHLVNVSRLSSLFGNKIGVKRLAFLCGLFHDFGKFSTEFKDYIIAETEKNDQSTSKRGSVDHSTAGAKYLFEEFHNQSHGIGVKFIIEIISNVILSHHMGLQDYLSPNATSNFIKRVQEKELSEFETVKQRFSNYWSEHNTANVLKYAEREFVAILQEGNQSNSSSNPLLTITFLKKYLFSSLIDADRTDARCFEENVPLPENLIDNTELFKTCYHLLIDHLDGLNQSQENSSAINHLRKEMSDQCDSFAEEKSGIYKLSIPTGGGKTLSSLRYGLKHAFTYGKDRIIYVVPFLSIIEQNALEVRDILGEHGEMVLEHHSNVIFDDDVDESDQEKQVSYFQSKNYNLAKDNWDSPIIFTTMVQFLDVIYSKGTRNIRRFHNMANAVIIFDEVQAVPVKCVSMFNGALNFLKNVCKSSILLCTATQPALDFVEKSIDGIDGEIIDDLDKVVDQFKRVEIVDKLRPEGWDTDDISNLVLDIIKQENSILVIFNTKKVVRQLYEELSNECKNQDIHIYHLSTAMCAEHRNNALTKVKKHLERKERVICISTQLIEAGVNISFDTVIRSLAGLDSIAQAAGRCNRHGESELKNAYVINHKEENLNHLKTIKVGGEITERILIDKRNKHIKVDLLSAEIMSLYFKNYYFEFQNELDYHVPKLQENLYSLLGGSNSYKKYYQAKTGQAFPLHNYSSLKTVGDHFNVIDQNTISILVPYKEGKDLIADFNEITDPKYMTKLLKKSQHFVVNIFDHEFRKLNNDQAIVPMMDGKIFVLLENFYDDNLGICIEEEGKMDLKFY